MSHPTQSTWSPPSPKPRLRSPLGTVNLPESPPPSLALGHPRACVAASAALMTPRVQLAGPVRAWGACDGVESAPPDKGPRVQRPPKHVTPFLPPAGFVPSQQTGLPSPQGPKQNPRQPLWSFFPLIPNLTWSSPFQASLSPAPSHTSKVLWALAAQLWHSGTPASPGAPRTWAQVTQPQLALAWPELAWGHSLTPDRALVGAQTFLQNQGKRRL